MVVARRHAACTECKRLLSGAISKWRADCAPPLIVDVRRAEMSFRLVRCDHDGVPIEPVPYMPNALVANCNATAELYRRIGFADPWVGYVAVDSGSGVGGGAFVGAPQDNCVEIAYFTLKEYEGRGYATRTVAALIEIARRHTPQIALKAFTLQEHNASTRILQRHGFQYFGDAHDRDAGAVWEWRV